ncbi:MAG: branched-chain amino acid ABC transporter permease [Dehalococcoidales bacterium]|nr:branched-chain amino acid ABC transporter permease [Dehalococcoidales bacterium]
MKKYNKHLMTYIVLTAIAAALPLGRDVYVQHLLTLTLILAIYALSYNIIVGYMGLFSFGHQAFFGLGGYTIGLLSLGEASAGRSALPLSLAWPVWATLPASLLVCAIAGYVIGYVSLQMRGVYLGLVTLGFAMLIWMATINERHFTGGVSGVRGIPPFELTLPGLPTLELSSPFSFYYFALVLLVFTIYFISRLTKSRFGRALVALRENEERASALGVDAFKYYLMAFTIAATLAGLAGFAYSYYLRYITPTALGITFLWSAVIMVIIGGTGTLLGPVIGAFIFVFVPEVFRIAEELRLLLFGAALVVVIIFLPQGIYPSLVSLWDRFILRRQERKGIEGEISK